MPSSFSAAACGALLTLRRRAAALRHVRQGAVAAAACFVVLVGGLNLSPAFAASASPSGHSTMLVRPLSGLPPGSDNSVLEPMTSTLPAVVSLKNFMSRGSLNIRSLFLPMPQFLSQCSIAFIRCPLSAP